METLETPPEASPPSQTLETVPEQNPSSTSAGVCGPEQIETRSDPGSGIQDGGVRVSDHESASAPENKGDEVPAVEPEVPSCSVGGGEVRVSSEEAAVDEKKSGVGDDVRAESPLAVGDSAVDDRALELKVGDGGSPDDEGISIGKVTENGVGSGEEAVSESKKNVKGGIDEVLVDPMNERGPPQSNGGCLNMDVDSTGGLQKNNSEFLAESHQLSSENEVAEKGCSSMLEEEKEGLSNESCSSGAAEAIAADACLTENGQDSTPTLDVAEDHLLIPEVEKNKEAEIIEAPVSLIDAKQTTVCDASDAGMTVSDANQQMVLETVAVGGAEVAHKGNEVMETGCISIPEEQKEGLSNESSFPAVAQENISDVGLHENGQDSRVEVVEAHIRVPDTEKSKEAEVVEASVSLVDEKHNSVGDVEDASDTKSQKVQKTVAVQGEEAVGSGSQLMEKVSSSMSEQGKEGLSNELDSSTTAQYIAMDVCIPENGQDPRAKVGQANIQVPKIEKTKEAEVEEAPISHVDTKQNTLGEAADICVTMLDEKQHTMPELVAGDENQSAVIEVAETISAEVTVMDVCLPENGHRPRAEVTEMHVEADAPPLDEKQNSVDKTSLSEQKQQMLPESVAGEGEHAVPGGDEFLEDVVACDMDPIARIDVTESVSAQFTVTDVEVVERHVSVLETRKIEETDVVESSLSLLDEKQNDVCDAMEGAIALSDEKQHTQPELLVGEGVKDDKDGNQCPEDGGLEVRESISTKVIVMDVCLPENGVNPVAEVVKMQIGVSDACPDEKQHTAGVAADADIRLSDAEQQVVGKSVAGEGQQVAEDRNISEDDVPGHDDLTAGTEVTKSASAQDMAVEICLSENAPGTGDDVAETQCSVPEMIRAEEAEIVEASVSPLHVKQSTGGDAIDDGNQSLEDGCLCEGNPSTSIATKEVDVSLLEEKENDVDDATDGVNAFSDEKQQQTVVTESVAVEEEVAADGHHLVEDDVLGHNNSSAGVEDAEISMSGAEAKEEEEEVEEDEEQADDIEEQFSVGDFVWGKIKSHPWWPGQIYDPSDASDFARKYRRRDRLLVAYFGDGTFAWCYPSQLKPFSRSFERMIKQSNTKGFLNAVEEALCELSRCVESELTCSCLPEETRVRLTRPVAVNAGIKDGITIPEGHIDGLSINEFDPANFIARLKDIATVVCARDTLELTVFKSRLLAFYGAKGYNELPMYHLPRLITDPEDDAQNQLSDRTQIPTEEDQLSPSGAPGVGKSCASEKRPQVSEDKIYQRRKRSVAELMAENMELELMNVRDEVAFSVKPVMLSKEQKKTKQSAASPTEEEDSDAEKDVIEEVKGSGKSASSSKKRKKGKHLGPSPSSLAENKASDVETDDTGEEEDKASGKSTSSSKKRKNSKHSVSSPTATEENKASDIENDDLGDEEAKTMDKSMLSSRTRKKTTHLESSPPASPDNKVTFDVEIDDGGAEEGALLSSPRNRRRSRYLSAPYTMLSGQKNVVSLDDSEAGNAKVPIVSRVGASISKIAVQLTGASPILKCSSETFQKKVSRKPTDEDKTPGTSGTRAAKKNRKINAPKEVDMIADDMLPDNLTEEDATHPKGGRKGKSTVTEHNSSGKDPYELKTGEKRSKEKEQTSSKIPKQRKSRRSSIEDTATHPAALLLTFEPSFALPSKDDIIEVFSKFGALNESETEVLKDSGCAQVVFTRSSDAEDAFNSSEKDCAFKPATVSYRLRYLSTASKASETDSPPSTGVDETLALPSPMQALAETQPLLFMQQNLESMMSLLSKFSGKEAGQAAKLTPTVRADLTVELGCLLQKVNSLVEDS